jgi:hypothetical protein
MMAGVLDMVTGSLEPTSTYARRDWIWVPASTYGSPDGRVGTLTIILQHSRRAGAKQEVDHYGVEEEFDTDAPAGVRSFLLENDTDPDDDGPFRCVVGADARGLVHDRCGCEAGKLGKACKHVATLEALVTEGVL